MKVDNFITHIDKEEDKPFLKTKLLDVNMRLYNEPKNLLYRNIVRSCCDYIEFCALQTMDGYKKPHGMSGANLAIPFNIIGVVRNREKAGEFCEIMINPKIIKSSKETEESLTNCGSLRLKEPIKVFRNKTIALTWFDIEGKEHCEEFQRQEGSFTIQHEVEHNLGILITDLMPF